MELGIGEWIVIGLSLVIGLFFIIGNWINDQRSLRAIGWLRRGLAALGEVKSARLAVPTSKGIPFKVELAAEGPFGTIQGRLALERRENLPLWAYQLLRGKRDSLVMLSDVHPGPESEIHVFHKSNLGQVEAARKGQAASLTFLKEAGSFNFYARGDAHLGQVERMAGLAAAYPEILQELTLQRKSPQMTVQVKLAPLLRTDAGNFFQALHEMIKEK